ncbi:MAG TPA: phosphoribosylformylglycinamidine cyclo-ligase [Candidatus Deferrimicrobiaceae bacterium]|nr:phosphoribosylformylglycinamidine cyclo-ligase [Candidatus Deferrimicrobiaceae bacterium]
MKKTVTYASAGVDIDEGERMVSLIRPIAATTRRREVLGGIGGFAGFFRFPAGRFRDPVLVSGTDGVGTKVKVAAMARRLGTVGIDLVAMCVNDILVHGAEPLFFLDYYATGKLSARDGAEIVSGIAQGCREAGCALLGGETAEMPSVYAPGEFDLAGFAVGAVDRKKIIDGSGVRPGDVLVGLSSSGLHSNGYSLARKVVFEVMHKRVTSRVPEWGATVAEELLRPTRIYVRPVLALARKVRIRGMAHITGGGIPGNVPRTLPQGLTAVVERGTWTVPPVFPTLVAAARLPEKEAYRTFNMGIGMVLIVRPGDADRTLRHFRRAAVPASVIGEVRKGKRGSPKVIFSGGRP